MTKRNIEVNQESHRDVIRVDFVEQRRLDGKPLPGDGNGGDNGKDKNHSGLSRGWKTYFALAATAIAAMTAYGATHQSKEQEKLSKEDIQFLRAIPDDKPVVFEDNLYYSHYGDGTIEGGTKDGAADLIEKDTDGTKHEVPFSVAQDHIETIATPGDQIVQDPTNEVVEPHEHIVAKIPLDKID